MTDDAERAAKAARAKALLKKRQQQKSTAPSSPSPAPRSPEPYADASVLFGGTPSSTTPNLGEFGELKSPAKAAKGPQPPPLHNGEEASSDLALRTLVDSQQQTISLLVNEKAVLSAQLDRFEDVDSKSKEYEMQLAAERKHAEALMLRTREMEEQMKAMATRLEELSQRERDLSDRAREQDRELELTRRTAGDLRTQLDTRTRELRELKEHVEADDRVEALERSLQGTQDRAEELALQLAKFKQSHDTVLRERDATTEELRLSKTREDEWRGRHSALQEEMDATKHALGQSADNLEKAERSNAELQARLAAGDAALADMRQERTRATSELAVVTQRLRTAEANAADAARLQAENSGLLSQLEEVRPKVVELSNKVADDEMHISSVENKARALEGSISGLEAQLEGRRTELAEARDLAASLERKHAAEAARLSSDLRNANDSYTKVVKELEHFKTLTGEMEREQNLQRERQSEFGQKMEQWKVREIELEAELENVRSELGERRKMVDDTQAVVARTQVEVEGLRDQLALREDEVARLRETSTGSSPSLSYHEDINMERLRAAQQENALEISSAHSRIRALETEVFEAHERAHAAEKRVASLTDELAKLRSRTNGTPPPDSRRTSLSLSVNSHSALSHGVRINARPVYDANLSGDTRHKREVSLGMLRARIERERAATSRLGRGATLYEDMEEEKEGRTPHTGSEAHFSSLPQSPTFKRPQQFLDESHVFWCHSCRGDLVVL